MHKSEVNFFPGKTFCFPTFDRLREMIFSVLCMLQAYEMAFTFLFYFSLFVQGIFYTLGVEICNTKKHQYSIVCLRM